MAQNLIEPLTAKDTIKRCLASLVTEHLACLNLSNINHWLTTDPDCIICHLLTKSYQSRWSVVLIVVCIAIVEAGGGGSRPSVAASHHEGLLSARSWRALPFVYRPGSGTAWNSTKQQHPTWWVTRLGICQQYINSVTPNMVCIDSPVHA